MVEAAKEKVVKPKTVRVIIIMHQKADMLLMMLPRKYSLVYTGKTVLLF
jgi:hypothetical protein